ncbi:hypothetical protein JTB14_036220 [Gonioctena quinquepunctata]|nr:hypothetical protein JTB14_036220 [Gonioctena quinquepunctata]
MNTETNTANNNKKCGWSKFSESKLIELEKKILNAVQTAYKSWFVPIGSIVGNDDKIWTVLLNGESKNTPLVLLHGFAAGLCFWCLNFDSVAKERPVYAIDLLGFGRSSRPDFSNDSLEAEQEMVKSLEEWRKKVDLDKFILLGHSFGGYLATSYAINYPNRVQHLVLADPWGFSEVKELPLWFKVLGVLFYPLSYLNPLATVRAAGPIGPWLVRKARRDISEKYGSVIDDTEVITEYIYQCNSQNPTGESAFHRMRQSFAWAKHPMIHRLHNLNEEIPITILYGENSWITRIPDDVWKEKRPESYTKVKIIKDAGHHINADQPLSFNKAVCDICEFSELGHFPNDEEVREEPKCEEIKKVDLLLEDDKLANMKISSNKI